MTQDVIDRHYLTPLLSPASVAIVGATERKGAIGEVLIRNMLDARFQGELYAVNPKHRRVHGVRCYPALSRLPRRAELAVIATPPATVPGLLGDCGRAGIRAVIVITAGFGETGPAGKALEDEALATARHYGIRVLGPNCLGVMRADTGFNATFATGGALPGSLALVSQSGALCTAMLDWARPHKVGFSSVVSLGGSSDVDFGEVIDFLVNDPRTEHILLYIEGVRDARRFMSSLRAAARLKPVILMKVGRNPVGSRAAVSHTGAIVGADDVFDAAIRRAGVVRVKTVGQLVAAAQALAAHVRPRGDRLVIITNGGGPGVMAADMAADMRIPLASLSPDTLNALQSVLPANWSHGNPVDLIGDATAERYRASVAACLADEGVDGALVILTPQAMTEPSAAADAVIAASKGQSKPVLTCWMGEEQVADGRRRLIESGHLAFRTPESAVEMFTHVSSYYRNQRALMQTPGARALRAPPDTDGGRALVAQALSDGRTVLSEDESKRLLAAFGLPVVPTEIALDEQAAVRCAERLGWPVALKVHSPDISHKTDAGGVMLNLSDVDSVRQAYRAILRNAAKAMPSARIHGVTVQPMIVRPNGREFMAGVIRDPVFGPAIVFGIGGVAVEIHRDRAIALPPLNEFLVDELIDGTRSSRLLGAFRNLPPVNRQALRDVLLRLSEMVCELACLDELDINPLIIDEQGVVIADARVVVRRWPEQPGQYRHMAIHPYPSNLIECWRGRNGEAVTLRPIRPEDADIEQEFVRGLSAESRHFRFMDTLRELTPSMLVRLTQIDYDREMAFIATVGRDNREVEVGVCRYVSNPDGRTCEFAIVVADDWQKQGLGRRMMDQLIAVARERGLFAMMGHVLRSNHGMLTLCERLGFREEAVQHDHSVVRLTLDLHTS